MTQPTQIRIGDILFQIDVTAGTETERSDLSFVLQNMAVFNELKKGMTGVDYRTGNNFEPGNVIVIKLDSSATLPATTSYMVGENIEPINGTDLGYRVRDIVITLNLALIDVAEYSASGTGPWTEYKLPQVLANEFGNVIALINPDYPTGIGETNVTFGQDPNDTTISEFQEGFSAQFEDLFHGYFGEPLRITELPGGFQFVSVSQVGLYPSIDEWANAYLNALGLERQNSSSIDLSAYQTIADIPYSKWAEILNVELPSFNHSLEFLSSWYLGFANEFTSLVPAIRDPLMIDLDGDGVNADILTGTRVYFDIDSDGVSEAVAWVNGNDGILARDLNGNGKIDDATEIFGNATTNGYEALRALDSNSDGQITSADTAFNTLKIWKDTNVNGVTDAGELVGLETYNISSIKLNDYVISGSGRSNVTHTGTAVLNDGTIVQTANYAVSVDQRNSKYTKDYDLDLRTLFLPTLRGYGNIVDLNVALSLDNGSASTSLISEMIALVSRDKNDILLNWNDVRADFKEILLNWAGVDAVASTSRGPYVDAKILSFIEAYTGSPFVNNRVSGVSAGYPGSAQADAIHNQFNELLDRLLGNVLMQTSMSNIMTGDLSYDPIEDKIVGWTTVDHALSIDFLNQAKDYALTLPDTAARTQFWTGFAGYLSAIDLTAYHAHVGVAYALTPVEEILLDDAIRSTDSALSWYRENHAPLNGMTSIEYRYENPTGDVIEGGSGNDNLTGTVNEDVIIGNAGADTIHGGDLADRIFGHGIDGIADDGASDTLYGGDGDDYIEGGDGDDFLYGEEGSDRLIGGNGNDHLNGGATPKYSTTQNIMEGGLGNDFYIGNYKSDERGSTEDFVVDIGGVDTFQFNVVSGFVNNGISSFSFVRHGSLDLWISVSNSGGVSQQVTLVDQFLNPELDRGIEYINFIYSNTTIDLRAFLTSYTGQITTQGSDANDIIHGITSVGNLDDKIYAGGGDDIIFGDAGDDYIDGQDGSDEIHGGDGNDILYADQYDNMWSDVIYGDAGNDTIRIGAGLAYGGSGDDYISAEGSGGSEIYGDDGNDTLILYTSVSGTAYGGNGNDTILGNVSNDFFYGGAGDDVINGSYGIDTVGYIDATNGVYVDLSLGYADELNTGHDTLSSIENASGSNFDDTLKGTTGVNALWGEGGNDILDGGAGADKLYGGEGNDILSGGQHNDILYGDAGNDQLNGGVGNDMIYGGDGDDTVFYAALSSGFVIYRDNPDYITIQNTGNTSSTGEGIDKIYNDVETITFSDIVLNLKDGTLDAIGSAWNYTIINGTSSGETLSGFDARDKIYGNGGNDTLYGNAHNDQLYGGDGADKLYGGTGSDDLYGELGNDDLYGQDGNDHLLGGDGSDVLYGDAGDDILNGGLGADYIHGGAGIDTAFYNADSTNFILYRESTGNLVLRDTGTSDITGAYSLNGEKIYDDVEKIQFNDVTLDLTTMTFVIGEAAWGNALSIYGTSSADSITAYAANDVIYGYAGVDYIAGGAGNDTLYGGDGNDTLNGDNGNDIIYGELGGDTINGGNGNDQIYGGDGQDTLWGDAGNDTLEGGFDRDFIHGGDGVDTVFYNMNSANFIVYRDAAGFVTIKDTGSTGISGITGTAGDRIYDDVEIVQFLDTTLDLRTMVFTAGQEGWGTSLPFYGTSGNDVIIGTPVNDRIYAYDGADGVGGGPGNDLIYGGAGNDQLYGEAGHDYIDGGAGNDIIDGGVGNDTISYESSSLSVTVNLSIASSQNTIGAGSDTITTVENIIGSSQNDTLTGNALDNIIEGGLGNDVMNGANGIDTVSYQSATSGVAINLSLTTAQDTLGAGNDTLFNFENILGSSFNDTLTGDSGANTIHGGDGNDVIDGNEGDDILNGGNGKNTVSYASAINGVSVNLSLSTSQNTVSAGSDTLSNFENIEGSSYNDILIGNAAANTIYAGNGNDSLDGGSSDDILYGGLGDDTYIYASGQDTISEVGTGTDRVIFDSALSIDDARLNGNIISFINSQNQITFEDINLIETFSFSGHADMTLSQLQAYISAHLGTTFVATSNAESFVGPGLADTVDYSASTALVTVSLIANTGTGGYAQGDTYSFIENVTGSAYGDTITGDAGNNTLTGGLGNDYLEGGVGNDLLIGGDGIDTAKYLGATSGVTVNLSIVGPQDTIGAGIDTLTSIEGIYGSIYNDVLIGDSGSNNIFGSNGDDIIEGGLGNDILTGGNNGGIDTLSYAGASAGVTVSLAITTSQNTGVTGTDSASGFENLTGSAFNDILTGDALANAITGGSGNDTIQGGLGDDILIGGLGTDVVSYSSSTSGVNISLLQIAAQNTGAAGSDTLSGFENIMGSSYNDILIGDASGNTISGGNGDDTLDGGLGDDALVGGVGNDTYIYSGGQDIVTETGADYERVVFASSLSIDNVTVTGNALSFSNSSNVITFNDISLIEAFSFNGQSDRTLAQLQAYIAGNASGSTFVATSAVEAFVGTGPSDTVDYSASTALVTINLLANTGAGGFAHGDTYSSIENLIGSTYADTITGNVANNNLSGGVGNDSLEGGAGNDTLNGGDGIDLARYSGAASAVTINLSIAGAQDTIGAGLDTLISMENIYGSAYNDVLTGDAGNNNIFGANGDDIIDGGLGNDILTGGSGIGIDTLSYESASAGVTVSLAITTSQNTGVTGVDSVSGFENLTGSAFNDILTGDALSNSITGGSGNDTLIGGLGADTLTGGMGSDTFKYLVSGLDTTADHITDFSTTQSDRIDLKDLLVGYDNVTSAIADFIEFTTSGANTLVKVDRDGAGSTYGWQQVAQLDNVVDLTDEAALKASGNLIVA